MKVEYTNCDICGEKIDTNATDKAIGKFEMVRVRNTFGTKGPLAPLSPFPTEKVGDVSPQEIMERVTVDTCEKCTKAIEVKYTDLKKEEQAKTKTK